MIQSSKCVKLQLIQVTVTEMKKRSQCNWKMTRSERDKSNEFVEWSALTAIAKYTVVWVPNDYVAFVANEQE